MNATSVDSFLADPVMVTSDDEYVVVIVAVVFVGLRRVTEVAADMIFADPLPAVVPLLLV